MPESSVSATSDPCSDTCRLSSRDPIAAGFAGPWAPLWDLLQDPAIAKRSSAWPGQGFALPSRAHTGIFSNEPPYAVPGCAKKKNSPSGWFLKGCSGGIVPISSPFPFPVRQVRQQPAWVRVCQLPHIRSSATCWQSRRHFQAQCALPWSDR